MKDINNMDMSGFFEKKRGGNRGNDRRGGYGKSRGSSYGHRSDDDHGTMHSAICSQCNVSCEVPFKPNGRKPVLCKDCFRKDDTRGPATRPHEHRYDKPAYHSAPHASNEGIERQLKTLNEKMDLIIEALSDEDEE